jgi:hypothetical protein
VQRIRIGLTGLAFVFLLVLLGAVFTGRPSNEEAITTNLIESQMKGGGRAAPGGAPANSSEPKEPLAELGVTPGNADNSTTDSASADRR